MRRLLPDAYERSTGQPKLSSTYLVALPRGIEPPTSCVTSKCSTIELRKQDRSVFSGLAGLLSTLAVVTRLRVFVETTGFEPVYHCLQSRRFPVRPRPQDLVRSRHC